MIDRDLVVPALDFWKGYGKHLQDDFSKIQRKKALGLRMPQEIPELFDSLDMFKQKAMRSGPRADQLAANKFFLNYKRLFTIPMETHPSAHFAWMVED